MLNSNAPMNGPPHFVDLHVNPGESVSIQLFDGNETVLRGPATITMISQHTFPPIPMPVQVPPGHMIQQIVDENGTLRHIILSALNNNGTPATNAIMAPQQQQQQPFPYCCCCCYSCTGGPPPTAPLPPPPPPPPPPVHHNILAFPTQVTRRRLPNRTYSPNTGKRASPAFYNNNTLGKSPIRSKISSTAAPVDGVSKVTYPNAKIAASSDNKSFELNAANNMDSKSHNENNCLGSESIHVVTNVCTKESHDGLRNGIVDNTHSILKQNPNQSYTFANIDDGKKLTNINEIINCVDSETSINSVSSDNEKDVLFLKSEVSHNDEKQSHLQLSSFFTDDITKDSITEVIEDNSDHDNEDEDGDDDNDKMVSRNESRIEFTPSDFEPIDDNEILDRDRDVCIENDANTYLTSQSKSCISSDNVQSSELHTSDADTSVVDGNAISEWKNGSFQKHSDGIINVDSDKKRQLNSNDHDKSLSSNDESHKMRDSERSEITDTDEDDDDDDDGDDEVNKSEAPIPSKHSPQRSPKHLLPQLQLLNLTYTSLTANTVKLKWTQSHPHSPDQLYAKHYIVEMLLKLNDDESIINSNPAASRIVYQGHTNNCRISHLTPQQQYSFRVRTTSDEHLVVSNILTITTPEQQPVNNKYHYKKNKQQILQQQIQQQQHQIHQQQMLLQQQQHMNDQQHQSKDNDEPAISSDQRCAILILLLFTMFALIVAVLIQHLLTNQI